jgi:VWFA-related protein
MKNPRLPAVILALSLECVSFAQVPDSSQNQKPAEGEVVRITTNLVQVDAVITDKSGRPVTDLKPEELQLFEDNRPRKITHFSYFANDAAPPSSKPVVRDKRMPGVPPDELRPEDVRRTIALVVDDLGLSFEALIMCDAR